MVNLLQGAGRPCLHASTSALNTYPNLAPALCAGAFSSRPPTSPMSTAAPSAGNRTLGAICRRFALADASSLNLPPTLALGPFHLGGKGSKSFPHEAVA